MGSAGRSTSRVALRATRTRATPEQWVAVTKQVPIFTMCQLIYIGSGSGGVNEGSWETAFMGCRQSIGRILCCRLAKGAKLLGSLACRQKLDC